MCGTRAICVTGARSRTGSIGGFLRVDCVTASVALAISSAWPSGGARNTASAPIQPDAPGRFSTTIA
jgi:hypothetical protein